MGKYGKVQLEDSQDMGKGRYCYSVYIYKIIIEISVCLLIEWKNESVYKSCRNRLSIARQIFLRKFRLCSVVEGRRENWADTDGSKWYYFWSGVD